MSAAVCADPAGTRLGQNRLVAIRILIVEDDARIGAAISLALQDEGYDVTVTASGESALVELDSHAPEVVLVDLMLPGMNGFEVTRRIRSRRDVPIIIVTARDDTHDVVAGLEAGADDYVTKPVEPKELAARIRALLRRTQHKPGQSDSVRFGSLEIEMNAGIVRRQGREVQLTKTEFRLLCELAVNAGLVLSREQLLERVWSYDYFGDARLVDAHIRRLRTKVEDDPADPQLIITLRGLGYRLVPDP